MATEELPINELPPAFLDAIGHELQQEYGVGFLRIEGTRNGQDAVLLGSSTLVTAGGKYTILTAHHVLQVLPKTGRLGLIEHADKASLVTYEKRAGFVLLHQARSVADGPRARSSENLLILEDRSDQSVWHGNPPVDCGAYRCSQVRETFACCNSIMRGISRASVS